MHPEIVEQQNKLQELFDEVKQIQHTGSVGTDLAVQLTWYLCIRTSGYIENSVQVILLEYVQSQTMDLATQNYIRANLRSITAEYGVILRTVRRFNESWRTKLRDNDVQRFRPVLNNLAKNRNEIAHGRDSKITLVELEGYFRQAQALVALLFQTCNSRSNVEIARQRSN